MSKKSIISVLLALVAFSLASCSRDDKDKVDDTYTSLSGISLAE